MYTIIHVNKICPLFRWVRCHALCSGECVCTIYSGEYRMSLHPLFRWIRCQWIVRWKGSHWSLSSLTARLAPTSSMWSRQLQKKSRRHGSRRYAPSLICRETFLEVSLCVCLDFFFFLNVIVLLFFNRRTLLIHGNATLFFSFLYQIHTNVHTNM